MARLRILLLVLAALAEPRVAEAQEPSYPTPWQWALWPTPTVSLSYPQGVSAGAELWLGWSRTLGRFEGQHRGFVLSAEPGVAGLSASLGVAFLDSGCTGMFGPSGGLVYLRTWGPHWGVAPNQNYLGIYASYNYSWLKFTGGLLKRQGGTDSPSLLPFAKASLVVFLD